MNRFSYQALFTISLCALALACSSAPTGPEAAIQEFYRYLNEGDYTRAMAQYNSEARGIFEEPETAGESVFAEWARTETKNGKVDRVQVVQEETSDERASVEYQIVYTDGTRSSRSVTLTHESGEWKLGLIS
jgi:hypothetical protein